MFEAIKDKVIQKGKPQGGRRNDFAESLWLGWGVIVVVFGGLVGWSVFAPFEGAVLTSGQIAVETSQQAVQHLEGGIVSNVDFC